MSIETTTNFEALTVADDTQHREEHTNAVYENQQKRFMWENTRQEKKENTEYDVCV